jgi:hypothetical protein
MSDCIEGLGEDYILVKQRCRLYIDYILVKQRCRNGVKCCKSYPVADIASGHKLVAMKMFVTLKRLRKP